MFDSRSMDQIDQTFVCLFFAQSFSGLFAPSFLPRRNNNTWAGDDISVTGAKKVKGNITTVDSAKDTYNNSIYVS